MPDTTDSLKHYLEAADGAGRLMAHAHLLIRLRHAYQEIAPTYLQQASMLANYKNVASDKIVVIHAHSGTIAAKLRQIAPRLAEGFCQRGFECNEVRIKVQVPKTSSERPPPRQKPLSANTYRVLAQLRERLPENSALQYSLSHLLARCMLKH